MSWRRAVGMAVAAVALVATGCGDDDAVTSPVTVPDTRGETPTSTTSTTAAAQEDGDAEVIGQIEAAYFAQWDAFVEILGDPDPANPLIDQHFAGAAKETLLDSIARFLANGQVARRPEDPSLFVPRVESVELQSEERAELIECLVDGLQLVDRETGEVVNDTVSYLRVRNEFQLLDDMWKVVDTEIIDRLEGASECAD